MTELLAAPDVPAAPGPRGPLPPRPESREALFAAVRSAYGLPDEFRFSAARAPEADASVAWALWDHLEGPALPRPHLPGDPPTRPLPTELRTPDGRRVAAALGCQVRALRNARGLTQRQLAEALGWDQPHVARLEGGGVAPNLATLALLTDRLGVRIVIAPGADGPKITLEAARADRGPR